MAPPEKKEGPGDWTRAVREAAPYLGIGTTLAVMVLAGVGLGYWADGKLRTRPVFVLLGAALGLFAAGYEFFKTVMGRKP